MTDKEKIIQELKEVLNNSDITDIYRLNLIRAIEYLQEEPVSEDLEEVNLEKDAESGITMTKEEAYNFLTENASNTQNGQMVHISCVEKAIKSVSEDEELREKALNGIYECEGNSYDWMQLGDAKYFIDIALGIKDEFSYF